MKIYSDSNYWLEFLTDSKTLKFNWKEGHEKMSYEDFQEACSNFIGHGFEFRAKNILIDVRNFKLQLPPEFPEWQHNEHHPRYHKLGIEKVVYLMPEQALENAKETNVEEAGFAQRNFSDEVEAMKWFNNQV